MNKKIAIIGAGGHGKVVGEIAILKNTKLSIFLMIRLVKLKNFHLQ